MNKIKAELDGAWEEPGVIGTRIEIDGRSITVLWRNSPVLETVFNAVDAEGYTLLRLKKNGLRYSGAASDYASIKSLTCRDGCMELTEQFPISGESRTVLKKTENSRYGNYEITDDVLKELRGVWKSTDGVFELEIKKDVLTLNGKTTRIHVLKSKSAGEGDGRYLLADRDPSVFEWGGFGRFEYCGGRLSASVIIFDAPPKTAVFEKVR
ncbi:MAG: hypothetical protein J5827_04025 [Oscillospiraceae bacterium]|nr:hypothetical protein [Oscillospiraceae bacterium]